MALTPKKRSIFDRISGAHSVDDDFEDEPLPTREPGKPSPINRDTHALDSHHIDPSAGELPVDVHQTPSEIIIRAFVAGVRADELNISISRDMVIVEGERAERENITAADSFTRELFWGSFARTIFLPQEIDVENSSAVAKDGLLTIILPKLDKARQTRLRVKTN